MISSIKCGDSNSDGIIKGLFLGGLPPAIYMGLFTELSDPASRNKGKIAFAMVAGFAVGGAFGALLGYAIDASTGYPEREFYPSTLGETRLEEP